MTTPSPRVSPLSTVLLALAVFALGFRLWTSLCFVPFADWNDVRLAPTFMLWQGVTPYPGLDAGPLTTWTYGPVPLLLNLPALLASDVGTALLIGGVINLFCAAVPVLVALSALTLPSAVVTLTDRCWAALLCLALWPNSSLHYIQSDNAAVAYGLLSCALLSDHRRHAFRPILAALCAALAVWSKQTSLGLVPAQLLWLVLTAGLKPALRYAGFCAGCGFGLAGVFIAWFGFDGLWLNLVALPGRFPFAPDVPERIRILWMALVGYLIFPAAGLLVWRRHIFDRASPWLMPALVWLFLLPTALLSTFGNGGSSNSLNSVLYLFPVAALTAVTWLRQRSPRTAAAWLAAGVVGVLTQQLSFSPLVPLHPLTAHLRTGETLARQFAGQIYFPWNPLLTFFAERRFYHVEDGLYTRQVAAAARPPAAIARDLPPAWALTALPGWRDYGVYKTLHPAEAQLGFFETWTVYTWKRPGPPPPPSPTPPAGTAVAPR